jgi:carbon-monoxide dehydrogenase large subunit
LVLGTQASGQGHETSFAQVITEWLGVPFDRIRLITGDTDTVTMGSGSHSSRSMRLAALLLRRATDEIIEKGKRIAARLLEADPADMRFGDGRFTVAGTNRSLGLFEVAAAAASAGLPEELSGKLTASAEISKMMPTFPNGCHVCEVEVDPETGGVTIVRHSAVDDVGRVINPLIVHGQAHGGIAQGVGQALSEQCAYGETGQLLSGSLMEYGLPRADDLPLFQVACNEVPAPNNPLGVKGAGEGGATGAPPAVINAIVDALGEFGVRHVEMPATPWRVWEAIHATGSKQR